MMKLFNQIFYVVVFLVISSLVIFKVLNIPITHDEVGTAIHYYYFNVWDIMMYPDQWPNNHILNTLITKLFINIFGNYTWSVRLANVLSLFIFFFAIFRINKLFLKASSIFVPASILLLLFNPYLLDFFGLCRGYAMATSLVTLSSSFLISGFVYKKERDIWISFILAVLGSYANFTTLVFWATICMLAASFFIYSYWNNFRKIFKKLFLLGFLSLSYLTLIYTPIYKMTSTNQFKYWNSNGLYQETIVSLANRWVYGGKILSVINVHFFAVISVLIFIVSTVLIILNIRKRKNNNQITPFFVSYAIVTLTVLTSLIQTLILKTPNLSARTALFLYPLFFILVIGLISKLEFVKNRRIKIVVALFIPILLILHLNSSFRTKSVYEWWYDENTLQVIDFLKKSNPDKTVKLKTHWLFFHSFNYYYHTGKAKGIDLEPNKNHDVEPHTKAEYYYITGSDKKLIEDGFEEVKRFGWDRWLMKRKNEKPD